jgi:hypothetical protein
MDTCLVALICLSFPGVLFWLGTSCRWSLLSALCLGAVTLFGLVGAAVVFSVFWQIPFSPLSASLAVIALSASLFIAGKKIKNYVPSFSRRSRSARLFEAFCILGTFGVSAWIWATSTADRWQIPNHDAMWHAHFVSNIDRFRSLQGQDVYANYLSGRAGRMIYPIGFEAFSAGVRWIANATPSETVFFVTAATVIFLWPIVLVCFARCFVSQRPALAALAAPCALAIHQFPAGALGWGGVTMILGIVVLLASVAVFNDFLEKSWLLATASLAIAMSALVAVHTSEAFLIPAFAAAASWPHLQIRNKVGIPRTAAVAMTAVAFTYPFIERALGSSMISGLANVGPNEPGSLYGAVGLLMVLQTGTTVRNIWPLLFLVVGFLFFNRESGSRRVLTLYVYCMGLALLASQATQPGWSTFSLATAPWYRQFQRMSYVLVPVIIVVATVGVANLVDAALSRVKEFRHTKLLRSIGIVGFPLLICTFAWNAHQTTMQQQKLLFNAVSVVPRKAQIAPSKDMRFGRIKGNVLASWDSGLGYWNIDYGVRVLSAPFLDSNRVALREMLLDGIVDRAVRDDVRAAVRDLRVTHIATNTRSMSGSPRPSPSDVENSGNFVNIWSGEGVDLWRLKRVSTSVVGSYSTWDNDSDGDPRRWLTSSDATLVVTNDDKIRRRVRIQFDVYQNPCDSTVAVEFEGLEIAMTKASIRLIRTLSIEPGRSVNLAIESFGELCPIESIGALSGVGLSKIDVVGIN